MLEVVIFVLLFVMYRWVKGKVRNSPLDEVTAAEFAMQLIEDWELTNVQVQVSERYNHIFYDKKESEIIVPKHIENRRNVYYKYRIANKIYYIKTNNTLRNASTSLMGKYMIVIQWAFFSLFILGLIGMHWTPYVYIGIYAIPFIIFSLSVLYSIFFRAKFIKEFYKEIGLSEIEQLSFFVALNYFPLVYIAAPGWVIHYLKGLFLDKERS